ncbi:hypothetical protein BDV98DRAFT_433948 [Pterulicium gracile]|uniref:Uncharacterized protein n=1 Tax=Pterulicium gracile TaxID=1884261 RepID=A0A5C3QP44_9AGAR|nr:hypothetical protein BDV98DRAFT_433948 [Pterula gracilis]
MVPTYFIPVPALTITARLGNLTIESKMAAGRQYDNASLIALHSSSGDENITSPLCPKFRSLTLKSFIFNLVQLRTTLEARSCISAGDPKNGSSFLEHVCLEDLRLTGSVPLQANAETEWFEEMKRQGHLELQYRIIQITDDFLPIVVAGRPLLSLLSTISQPSGIHPSPLPYFHLTRAQ